MKFKSTSKLKSIQDAIEIANQIKPDLIKELKEKKFEFLSSNIDSEKLAEIIENSEVEMTVVTYYYWRKSVMGYFTKSKPYTIHMNKKAFPRRVESIVATCWHEAIHALDALEGDYFFDHGNNSFQNWKRQTAPYWTDDIAENLARKVLGIDYSHRDKSENSKIIYRRSFVTRLKRFFRSIF